MKSSNSGFIVKAECNQHVNACGDHNIGVTISLQLDFSKSIQCIAESLKGASDMCLKIPKGTDTVLAGLIPL